MTDAYEPEPANREVDEADRALRSLFESEEPSAADAARTWQRIERQLEPRAIPWSRRIGGWLGGTTLGAPRRLALGGVAAALVLGAVVLVPSLGGNSASAAILEAVDELSASTDAALNDDSLSAAELRDLRERADALLRTLQEDPDALRSLNLDDLSAAITALQQVETLLVAQQAGDASTTVARVAAEAERALEDRDPSSPLLARESVDVSVEVATNDGRRSFSVGQAGTVVLEVRDGTVVLLAARPSAGWTATAETASGREIKVRFQQGDALEVEVEFEAELEDGRLSTKVESSSGSSGSNDDDTESSDDGDEDRGGSNTGSSSDDDDDDDDHRSTATATAIASPSETSTPPVIGEVRGTLNPGTSLHSLTIGPAGTAVVNVSGGLTLVTAISNSGWALVRRDIEDDRFELRFAQGTTEWRFDARIRNGAIEYEVSRHLNETPSGSSSSDDD